MADTSELSLHWSCLSQAEAIRRHSWLEAFGRNPGFTFEAGLDKVPASGRGERCPGTQPPWAGGNFRPLPWTPTGRGPVCWEGAAQTGPQERPSTSLPNLVSIPPCKPFWSTVIKISLRGSWKSQRPFLIKWSTVHFESLTGSIKITGRRRAGHITILSSPPGQSPSPKPTFDQPTPVPAWNVPPSPNEIWPPFKASFCSHLLPEAFPGPTSWQGPFFPLKSCSHIVYPFARGFVVVCLELLFTHLRATRLQASWGTWPRDTASVSTASPLTEDGPL